jgi:hypothetical protein
MGIHYHRSWFDRAVRPAYHRAAEETAFWLGVVIFWLFALLTVALLDHALR